jgi:hypothetical protein
MFCLLSIQKYAAFAPTLSFASSAQKAHHSILLSVQKGCLIWLMQHKNQHGLPMYKGDRKKYAFGISAGQLRFIVQEEDPHRCGQTK